jgi:hypothetical protein
MSDVTLEAVFHIARKRFVCDHCGQLITPGQRYLRIRGIWDGDPGIFRAHDDCHWASEALIDNLNGIGDEGSLLSDDVQPEDHWWLLQDFPVVAERLGIVGWAKPAYPPMTMHWIKDVAS